MASGLSYLLQFGNPFTAILFFIHPVDLLFLDQQLPFPELRFSSCSWSLELLQWSPLAQLCIERLSELAQDHFLSGCLIEGVQKEHIVVSSFLHQMQLS